MLMIQVFALQFVGLLACLAYTVLAQFDVSEAVTASASFPDVAITCVGNLAVFFSCLLRGRLHVEMGARDLLATITAPKLHKHGSALRTYGFPAVVILSNHTPESSTRQFMQYIHNTHAVRSCLLQFHRLRSEEVTADDVCNNARHACRCIVIEAPFDLYFRPDLCIKMLASRMPGALKRLSDSQCLLPCMTCLTNGCHGCNHGMLHVVLDESSRPRKWTLTEGGPKEWPVPVVCQMLEKAVSTICEDRSCICIPAWPAERDRWTEMLIRCLKTKDKEDRGVTNPASEALEKYIAQSGVCDAKEEYSTVSLILPRVAEIVINIILTACFRVDGFSSSLVARRVIRDYVVDSRGTGIAANVFLKKCQVYSNAENTDVCQVLNFRGNLLNFRTFSFIIGGVNLMCSISWGVLIAIPGNCYDTLSMPPSKARIVILIVAIGVALLMDCLQFYLYSSMAIQEAYHYSKNLDKLLLMVMILEIVCMIVGTAVLVTLGIKGFGKWTYSAIQVLVWVKWALGAYSLGTYSFDKDEALATWAFDVSAGHGLMCASAFLLNAVLAGVRGKWKYSQS